MTRNARLLLSCCAWCLLNKPMLLQQLLLLLTRAAAHLPDQCVAFVTFHRKSRPIECFIATVAPASDASRPISHLVAVAT
jgi:hypothetical protein